MLKKILLTFFIFILNIFTINISSADFMYTENVEDVFSDISSDYKYLDELQILYENWMIKPDVNWKFNPPPTSLAPGTTPCNAWPHAGS